MANKLLKTLGIDELSLDVWNDRLPHSTTDNYIIDIPLSTTMTYNDFFTATEKGLLIGLAQIYFSPASASTEYKVSLVQVVRDGVATDISTIILPAVAGAQTRFAIPFISNVISGDTYRLGIRNSIGSSSANAYFKWVFIPDVVGGVVRLLKNLICYRPLNFGKAVA